MALETLMDRYQPARNGISVLITDDATIQQLNQEWRGLDHPTDVLSWPAPEVPGNHLGDICISLDTARAQAESRGDTVENEVALLGIHGGLHLLGFDDETDHDREEMLARMLEVAIAAGLNMAPEWSSLPHGEEDHAGRA